MDSCVGWARCTGAGAFGGCSTPSVGGRSGRVGSSRRTTRTCRSTYPGGRTARALPAPGERDVGGAGREGVTLHVTRGAPRAALPERRLGRRGKAMNRPEIRDHFSRVVVTGPLGAHRQAARGDGMEHPERRQQQHDEDQVGESLCFSFHG